MSGPEYQAELRTRGFHYHDALDRWVGPFNISLTGFLNNDAITSASSARIEALAVVDERLRAKRECPRPRSSGGASPGLI
jgi:hypothetical protein